MDDYEDSALRPYASAASNPADAKFLNENIGRYLTAR
jgi:hypothetical protein